MAFLRFSRDKRGYEHTYLVQSTNKRGKPVKPRILYWYRTPPGVRLGRSPFDDEVRKLLEAQNPGVVFDWATLASTPFPSQEPEFWRERRRAEKAAKQARREEEGDEAGTDDAEGGRVADASGEGLESAESAEALTIAAAVEDVSEMPEAGEIPAEDAAGDGVMPTFAVAADPATADGQAVRKRRRRGGRRRRARPAPTGEGGAAQGAAPESGANDPSNGTDPSSEEQE